MKSQTSTSSNIMMKWWNDEIVKQIRPEMLLWFVTVTALAASRNIAIKLLLHDTDRCSNWEIWQCPYNYRNIGAYTYKGWCLRKRVNRNLGLIMEIRRKRFLAVTTCNEQKYTIVYLQAERNLEDQWCHHWYAWCPVYWNCYHDHDLSEDNNKFKT